MIKKKPEPHHNSDFALRTCISRRLRLLRGERKLSRTDLCNEAGVGKDTYNHWEDGDSTPNVGGLVALANYYMVSVDYLLGRTERREPYS